MAKKGLNIYFIHSSKIDYNNDIYLPVLRSNLLSKHTLIFPETNANRTIYYKDLMDKADVFVVELTNPDAGMNLQLKQAIVLKKPILALAKKNIGYDEKYQKLLKNVIGYSTGDELNYYVETFVTSYKDRINGGVVDSTVVLGVLN
jgi:hypothetical protein